MSMLKFQSPPFYALLFIFITALVMVSKAISKDWTLWIGDLVSLLSVFLILVVVPRFPASWKKFLIWVLLAYSLALCLLTLYTGLTQLMYGSAYERVQLFLPNENILGASLVVAFLAVSVFHQRLWLVFLLFLTFLAVVLTGSRTALVALLISSFIWLILNTYTKRQKIIVLLSIATLLLIGGITVWRLAASKLPANERNLLRSSGYFEAPYWRKQHAASLDIFPKAVSAPLPNYFADRLVGQSKPDKSILLLQLVETSKPDQNYIGSIYLRSDQPQEIVVFALGQVTCQVTIHWQRCVTPATPGNGKTKAQLRLQTVQPGQAVDIYLWGAQLEVGDTVSELAIKDPLLSNYLKRFVLSLWLSDAGVSSRQEVAQAAWKIFLENPLAGVGNSHFTEALKVLAASNQALARMTHSHNLPLQVLATQGILGFLAIVLLFGGTLFSLGSGWTGYGWTRVLPLVLGVFVLNMTDLTIYSGSIYYVYWATLSLFIKMPGSHK